ncbi:MAG: LacI family DNA-binding transcriptional regulator [Kutzneria sp.]|nr:LacI family DNA-binding transcriptional regulator [Kutzneria sp.]
MISIKDVARYCGVSIATVSNVINRPELVADHTRRRVLASIESLGYVRSESARQLRVGHGRMLALLVLDMGNPFFTDVARGAERVARAAGVRVMVCNSDHDFVEEAEHLKLCVEQRVRGVLATPVDPKRVGYDALLRHGIPYVLVDRDADGDQVCSVSVNDVAGGVLAARHLVSLGHRRIAAVIGPASLPQCRDRLAGVRAGLREAAAPGGNLVVLPAAGMDVTVGRRSGARLLELVPRPTAVVCVNDLVAFGVLQEMFHAGVRVPEEMAIVGYDDIEFAAAAAVPLTSVRQPARDLGRTAATLLIEETGPDSAAHRHQQIVFEPELIVRGSTVPRLAGIRQRERGPGPQST